jgi:hypothetical protein
MRDADARRRLAERRAAEHFAAKIGRISAQAKATRSTGFHVPTLDADPEADDPTNDWLLEDGRRRSRTADGNIHEFVPISQLRPPIPTFATDPAASTGWRLWFNGGTGELRGRLANGSVVTYVPVTAGSSGDGGTGTNGGSTSTKTKSADPTPKKYRKPYPATWGRTFCATHGVETGARLRYGTFSGSYHGMRKIMLGFDDAAIRADLAGATIRDVELTMLNTDSWSHGGIDVHFGAHNKSGPQGSFSAVRRNVWDGHWPETGTGPTWRDVPDWIGKALRDNTIKGLTIDQPSSSAAYYGEISWASVELRITYTK